VVHSARWERVARRIVTEAGFAATADISSQSAKEVLCVRHDSATVKALGVFSAARWRFLLRLTKLNARVLYEYLHQLQVRC